jgi:hypothetical protein
VLLPASYFLSQTRYPVVYWLTAYEQSTDEREAEFVRYAATHDVIVVQSGPAETSGDFPLYLPELIEYIDKTFRTAANREHRAITGFAAAGFAAFLLAGKYPDLFVSASASGGPTEATAGPRDFGVEYRLDDMYANLSGLRTRLVLPPSDSLDFYHRRLEAAWASVRAGHQTVRLDSAAPGAGIAETLDFHLESFRAPLARTAAFDHADPWPNFAVWGWQVASERRQPGFTVLENVGPQGFRSAVREWLPSGALLEKVRLSIVSPPLAKPGAVRTVTYLRLRDGKVRRASQKADARGRLTFDLDGDLYEVGISAAPAPLVAAAGYELLGAGWAAAGQPLRLRVRFSNKGTARFAAGDVKWESPNPSVRFEPPTSRLFALAPGETGALAVSVHAGVTAPALLRVTAAVGASRVSFDIPIFPEAPPPPVFRIADGADAEVYQHAVERTDQAFGSGNGDGHAAPGETFAILIPDGEWLRAAELFGADPCIDNTLRGSDSWDAFDRSGASAPFSLPTLSKTCTPGKTVRMLARILLPSYEYRYYTIEFPVWYAR